MSFCSKFTLFDYSIKTHLHLFIHFLLPVSTGALPDDASRSVRSEKHDLGVQCTASFFMPPWLAPHVPLNSAITVFGVLPMLSVVLPSKFHNYIIIFLPFGKSWWWQICLHGERHSFCIWAVLVFKASAIQSQRIHSSLSWNTSQYCVRSSVPSQQKRYGAGSGCGITCYYHTGHHLKVVSQVGRKAYWRFHW